MPEFDATITIGHHHLMAAGLDGRRAEAIEVVRKAVEAMERRLLDQCRRVRIPTA